MQSRRQSNPVLVGVQLAIVALIVVAGVNYQSIFDQYALETFHPTAEVAAIESRMGLTKQAKATFYRAQPQIDDKAAFNQDCDTRPHELELGCYYHSRIFILRIDNATLATEMDVVTSHELLHAAWARMSAKEKASIGAELERVYTTLDDDELRQRMAGYAKSEPGEEKNELHSILGTEFLTLSPMLEAHYGKYFEDRSKIVAAHAKYQGVFSSRRAELERELAQIRADKGRLGVLNQQLESLKAKDKIEEYNALVPKQNRMVDAINKRIASYRLAVDEYNALSKSLDSQQITDIETPAQ